MKNYMKLSRIEINMSVYKFPFYQIGVEVAMEVPLEGCVFCLWFVSKISGFFLF